jgi:hypothetical protein
VVSEIGYALGPDADKSGACPNGMTSTARDAYMATPEGRKRPDENDNSYNRRIAAALGGGGGPSGRGIPTGPNACSDPDATGPDPYYRTVAGKNIQTYGIDLDGKDSRGRADKSGCAHEDFPGMGGARGVDNQFYRAVGCARGFQSSGGKLLFGTEMLTGSWGILISVSGVDNPLNDDQVEVGIYANADPIQLSSARKPLQYASYAPDKDQRFRAQTRGRIVNGVLTTEPVNVRLHSTTNNMWLERTLDDARLRMSMMKDGSLDGILAGYANVDELYDVVVGYRTGKDAQGNPARQRVGSAIGSSASAGVSCNGIYHALKQLADGHRDPKTGKCSAISTQYRIKAIPAFIVDGPGAQQNRTASAK